MRTASYITRIYHTAHIRICIAPHTHSQVRDFGLSYIVHLSICNAGHRSRGWLNKPMGRAAAKMKDKGLCAEVGAIDLLGSAEVGGGWWRRRAVAVVSSTRRRCRVVDAPSLSRRRRVVDAPSLSRRRRAVPVASSFASGVSSSFAFGVVRGPSPSRISSSSFPMPSRSTATAARHLARRARARRRRRDGSHSGTPPGRE